MKNIRGTRNDWRESFVIANINIMVCRLGVYPRLHTPAREIVDDMHVEPAFYELRNKMGADESCTAGNDRLFHASYSTLNSSAERVLF